MSPIRHIRLRRLDLPLVRPYRLAYRTFENFEPFMVELETEDGRTGFADAHVSPGSSAETREGAWDFLCRELAAAVGKEPAAAKASALDRFTESKVAATAFVCALEVLEENPQLSIERDVELPLLTPVNALEPAAIEAEIEDWLGQGFSAFKIKVGKDVAADLERVSVIQKAVGSRATLRLDANRAYSRDEGIAFASRLEPAGIELFEQPCDSDDWHANAAVAAASAVPLMLDEPICTIADIERAAEIANVGFCKLKLKRFGGLDRLKAGLDAVRDNGMEPVLGDGLGSEIHGWLEACVAATTIRNAGEFNGFLKPRKGLFETPLPFSAGSIRLPTGYMPSLDRDAVDAATTQSREFE